MKIHRLREAKTSQLRKLLNNGNITEEQFQIADEFFKKYSAFEKEIDWNKGLKVTWDDLKEVIYKERSSESQTKKKIRKGLEGFEEGKDYLILKETDSYTVYQPFTWEASRMIASHYVEPSRNKDDKIKDAEWCTAYQKDRNYWDEHNDIEAFIYICGESIPSKKVAISISEEEYDASGSEFIYSTDNLNFNIWDFEDYKDTIEEDELLEVVFDLYDLIENAYNNWENKSKEDFLSKLKLNPQTNRYDYDGDLDFSNRKLKGFLAKDGDGFTINFGEVTGNFLCYDLGLTSLKGAPKEVGGDFDCSNNQLTSLKGAPQKVGGNFYCDDNKLTSLEGAPQRVEKSFNCGYNEITSLKGAPKYVRDFICSGNYLISLEGAPQTVLDDFICSSNKLTSLEGAPQKVGGDFHCLENRLTSLEGAPKEVGGNFWCYNNNLRSLKGAPQEVGGNFDCRNNQLTSLKGAPQEIGENFYCSRNQDLHSLEGLGKVKGKIYKSLRFKV